MTFDNGKEFAEHHRLKLDVYFADPYASWQPGTNGLLRQYFPKGADFTRIADDEASPRRKMP
jgi:IS30 family transposase